MLKTYVEKTGPKFVCVDLDKEDIQLRLLYETLKAASFEATDRQKARDSVTNWMTGFVDGHELVEYNHRELPITPGVIFSWSPEAMKQTLGYEKDKFMEVEAWMRLLQEFDLRDLELPTSTGSPMISIHVVNYPDFEEPFTSQGFSRQTPAPFRTFVRLSFNRTYDALFRKHDSKVLSDSSQGYFIQQAEKMFEELVAAPSNAIVTKTIYVPMIEQATYDAELKDALDRFNLLRAPVLGCKEIKITAPQHHPNNMSYLPRYIGRKGSNS